MALTPRKINAEDSYKPIEAASASTKALARGAYGFTTIETGASGSIGLSHDQANVVFTNSAPVWTLPAQASVAFPAAFSIGIIAAHGVTINAASGVSINGVSGASEDVEAAPAFAALVRRGSNDWLLVKSGGGTGGEGTDLTISSLNTLLDETISAAGVDLVVTGSNFAEVAAAADDTTILQLMSAFGHPEAADRSGVLGVAFNGSEDTGPVNRGELIFVDADGQLTGLFFTPAPLANMILGTGDYLPQTVQSIGTLNGALLFKGSDLASASSIEITSGYHVVTGTTTIAGATWNVDRDGRSTWLRFSGVLQLTHSATFVLPTAANITTAAGDWANLVKDGSATRVRSYTRADGTPLAGGGGSGLSFKESVRVATTANGTLATAFENGDTIDGVVLATGNRILIKNQNTGSENGIYVVQASGAPVRATDADTGAEMLAATVVVQEGTSNADTLWVCTTNATITLGSTSLSFSQITSSGGTAASTTEALTGTDAAKFMTADATAALWEKGSDIASASTISVGEGGVFHVTGTTTITDIDFATDKAGRSAVLIFDGACQVTHNASTLIIAGGSNYTSVAGDAALVISEGSDVVRFFPPATAGSSMTEWTAASASGSSTLDFFEDTDNGSNRVRLTAPASIASDVTMTLPALSETVKATGAEMEWIPAASMTPRPTSGAEPVTVELSTNKVVFDALAFSTSADEFAQWTWRPPKRWNVGTFTFIPIWAHPSTTTNFSVLWGIQALARSNDDAGDTAFGTAVTSQGEGGTTSDIYMGATTSACTASGTPAAADLLFFQVYRDVDGNGTATNDDLAVDAYLLGVVMIWTSSAANDA